jgi:hypothetical protein
MNYTLLAKGTIDILKIKLSFDSYCQLEKELQKYISSEKSVINLGDIHSAADALGIDISLIDAEDEDVLTETDDAYEDEIIDEAGPDGEHVQHIITKKVEPFEE